MVTYIEYTDIQHEAVFTLPCFDIDTTPDDLLLKHTAVVNDAILCAIGNMADNPEWERVPCLLTDDGVFDITRDKLDEQYNPCLAYYVKNEDYENASLLQSLYKTIKDK